MRLMLQSALVLCSSAVAATGQTIELLDKAPFNVWLTSKNDSLSGTLTLTFFNRTDSLAKGRITAIGYDGNGNSVAVHVDTMPALPPNTMSVQSLGLSFTDDASPRTVLLFFRFPGWTQTPTMTSPIPVHLARQRPVILYGITVVPFVIAVIGVIVGWSVARHREKDVQLGTVFGNAKWDFTKSWASNVTVLGAVIGSVMTFGALPADTAFLSRGSYQAMNLLWMVVITLAPAVFNFFREEDTPADISDVVGPTYHGYVFGFLLACVFTMWAVFGQLATLGVLFTELEPAHLLPGLAISGFQLLLIVLAVGLFFYGSRSILITIRFQQRAEAAHTKRSQRVQEQVAERTPLGDAAIPQQPLVRAMKRAQWSPL